MDNINDNTNFPVVSSSKVFSNEFLLKNIFKNLRVPDLKRCRGVNILWCREATTSLLSKHITKEIRIEVQYNKTIQFRIFLKHWEERISDAGDFVAMISSSIIFPCNSFLVQSTILMNTTIESFFNFYGEKIKALKIESDLKTLDGPIVKGMEDLLTKQVTKLQSLTITGVPTYRILASVEFLQSVKLKYLTTLHIDDEYTHHSFNFIKRILNAAVNLKVVSHSHDGQHNGSISCFLRAMVRIGKAHLLDRCDFFISNFVECIHDNMQKQIDIYEAIVNSKPKLKEISFELGHFRKQKDYYFSQLATVISKCLELNSQNLMNINYYFDDLLRLPGLRIPRLPMVFKIECNMFGMNYLDLLEGNLLTLSFAETFPNLKSIVLFEGLSLNDVINGEVASNYLDNVVPCLNVSHCEYNLKSNPPSPSLLEYFGIKFPNMTHLDLPFGGIVEFFKTSQHIWTKLTMLESIKIWIGFNTASDDNNYPGLEAAFTGFSFETCLRLKDCITEGKNVREELPNLEELRINPSILNLSKLSTLELTFDMQFWLNWDPTSPLLTAVTGQFAFALCPKLSSVCIQTHAVDGVDINPWTDESNPFQGIRPYIREVNITESFASVIDRTDFGPFISSLC